MSLKKLRPYQTDCISSIIGALKENKNEFYVNLPVGSGKTMTTVKLIEKFIEMKPDLKAFFIIPKNVLVNQTVNAFPNPASIGVYNAGANRKELDKQITVASIQSLVNAKELPYTNILFFDEAHMARKSHFDLYERFKLINPKCKLVGLTATDFKMHDNWSECVFRLSMRFLTDEGYLAPIVTQETTAKVDLTGVAIQGGDYNVKQLGERFTDDKIGEQVADLLVRSRHRKFILIMCTSIKHAESVHELIDGSFLIHSTLHKDEQKSQLDMWRLFGGYLVSVLIPSTGFDYPPADCLALMRPTRSPTLYMQAVGRIARISPNKVNGLFLDYGNIIENLGFVYDIRKSDKGEVRHRVCPSCEVSNEVSAKKCSECGEVFVYMCGECLLMVPYGHSCVPKPKIDALKNTTATAYIKPSPWKPVNRINKVLHKTKKGGTCLRIDYFDGIFRKVISEYFSFYNEDFKMWLRAHADYKHYITPIKFAALDIELRCPTELLLVDNGKYKKVQSRKF